MTTPPSNADTASGPTREQLEGLLNAYGQTLEDPAVGRPAPQAQPKVKKRKKLEVTDGSKLAFMMTRLPELEARKREAEEELAEAKAAIQAEVAATVETPEDLPDVFDIPASPHGSWPAYTMAAREGAWRVDTEAMKAQAPEEYVRWAKKGAPYWELRKVQRNRVKRG